MKHLFPLAFLVLAFITDIAVDLSVDTVLIICLLASIYSELITANYNK